MRTWQSTACCMRCAAAAACCRRPARVIVIFTQDEWHDSCKRLQSRNIVQAVGAGIQSQSLAMPHFECCSVSDTHPAQFSSVFSQHSSASSFLASFRECLLGQSSCTNSQYTFRANATTGICCEPQHVIVSCLHRKLFVLWP